MKWHQKDRVLLFFSLSLRSLSYLFDIFISQLLNVPLLFKQTKKLFDLCCVLSVLFTMFGLASGTFSRDVCSNLNWHTYIYKAHHLFRSFEPKVCFRSAIVVRWKTPCLLNWHPSPLWLTCSSLTWCACQSCCVVCFMVGKVTASKPLVFHKIHLWAVIVQR